jgi:processive 1,2-diacylglycerol beta-glucosyltransferase
MNALRRPDPTADSAPETSEEPRILILSASVGGGHTSAGTALKAALHRLAPRAEIQHLDTLSLTQAPFRVLYRHGYLGLVDHAPMLLAGLYDWMDEPSALNRAGDRIRLVFQRMNLSRFDERVSGPWDAIACTHFLPAELLADLKRKERLHTPTFTAVTDFFPHRLWVHDPCDGYFVPTGEAAEILALFGVPKRAIHVTGIPIHPDFAEKVRPENRSFSGRTGWPTVLQLAGGAGTGPIEATYRRLLDIEKPMNLIVVTGKNESARKTLEAIVPPQRHQVRIFGFTDRMPEFFSQADLAVSKPGGLTVSEACASGVPLVIIRPVPGQESANSDFLLENGAAVKIGKIPLLTSKLEALLNQPAQIENLRRNALRLGTPRAALDMARTILQACGIAAKTIPRRS